MSGGMEDAAREEAELLAAADIKRRLLRRGYGVHLVLRDAEACAVLDDGKSTVVSPQIAPTELSALQMIEAASRSLIP